MLVYEGCGIVDFVVHHDVEILLGVVLRNIRIGERFFGGHVRQSEMVKKEQEAVSTSECLRKWCCGGGAEQLRGAA